MESVKSNIWIIWSVSSVHTRYTEKSSGLTRPTKINSIRWDEGFHLFIFIYFEESWFIEICQQLPRFFTIIFFFIVTALIFTHHNLINENITQSFNSLGLKWALYKIKVSNCI